MINLAFLPTKYSDFNKKRKRVQNVEAKALLNRFTYRYRLALCFKGLNAPEVGRTLLGYDAIMKIFLAYTAFDEVYKAARLLKVYGNQVQQKRSCKDLLLAARVRKSIKLKEFITSYNHNPELKEILEYFFQNKINDIVCINYALRNMFAHGDLTPSAIGATNKKERQLLSDLATTLLDYSNEMFGDCVDTL